MLFFHQNKNKYGFTLIELLVVVAIIGLLSSVIFASLDSARAKARDTRRIVDLKQLQTALELDYNDNGKYPGAVLSGSRHHKSSVCVGNSPLNASYALWTAANVFDASFTNSYMKVLPADPLGDCYTYILLYGGAATGWRCYTPTATINPNLYFYLITFKSESSLSNTTYPGWQSAGSARRCILGPAI